MQNTFLFRASLKKSWSVFKTNWILLVGGLVGYYMINLAFSWFAESLQRGRMFSISSTLVSLIGTIVSLVILLGYYNTGLRLSEKKSISFKGLITVPNKLLGNAIIVQILRSLIMLPVIIVAGILFFIIGMGNLPAGITIAIVGLVTLLYIQLRTGFTIFLSIDHYETMKPWAIIKHAWSVTAGKEWLIVVFVLKIVVLNILGAIPFGLGLFITIPLTMLIAVDFYRTYINSKTGSTESVHTDIVVKNSEIEAPEVKSEPEAEISESTDMNSESGDSETATV